MNQELYNLCKQFVEDNKISCPETVHQCDRVIINSYDFIEKMCDIVGYYKYPDD